MFKVFLRMFKGHIELFVQELLTEILTDIGRDPKFKMNDEESRLLNSVIIMLKARIGVMLSSKLQ